MTKSRWTKEKGESLDSPFFVLDHAQAAGLSGSVLRRLPPGALSKDALSYAVPPLDGLAPMDGPADPCIPRSCE